MARSVGPELDDLQRLIRRLQIDETDVSVKPDSAPHLTAVPSTIKSDSDVVDPIKLDSQTDATAAIDVANLEPSLSLEPSVGLVLSQAALPTVSPSGPPSAGLSSLDRGDRGQEHTVRLQQLSDVTKPGGDDLSATAEIKIYRGALRGADNVQTTRAELKELRSLEPPRARELQELARREGNSTALTPQPMPVANSSQTAQPDGNALNGSVIFAIAVGTVVATLASVLLMTTFAPKPAVVSNPASVAVQASANVPAQAERPDSSADANLKPSASAPIITPDSAISMGRSLSVATPITTNGSPGPSQPTAVAAASPVPSPSAVAPTVERQDDRIAPTEASPTVQTAAVTPSVIEAPATIAPLTMPSVWQSSPGIPFKFPVTVTGASNVPMQLLISGLEADAVVGNGLEILPGTWLIEQKDIASATLDRGASAKPSLPIDVQLRTAEGQLIARERVVLKTVSTGTTPGPSP